MVESEDLDSCDDGWPEKEDVIACPGLVFQEEVAQGVADQDAQDPRG